MTLSPRARRAVGVMVAASIVIAGTGIYYLWPKLETSRSPAASQPAHFPSQALNQPGHYAFISPTVGLALDLLATPDTTSGRFSVYQTVDGARHWREVLAGNTASIATTDSSLRFIDSAHAFLVADDPLVLYRSSDAGQHWMKVSLPSPDTVDVVFIDSRVGWAAAVGLGGPNPVFHFFSSHDAGSTWTTLPDPPKGADGAPAFRNASVGWSGARDPDAALVYLTTDGGQTWAPRYAPQTPGAGDLVTGVRLLPHEGALVEVFSQSGFGGVVARFTTFDEGSTWAAVTEPFPGIPSPYEFQDATHWWLIGGLSLYKTADGGRSWAVAGRVPQGLELIGVIDARHAWAFDDAGYGIGLASTSDGGSTWQYANVPVPQATS